MTTKSCSYLLLVLGLCAIVLLQLDTSKVLNQSFLLGLQDCPQQQRSHSSPDASSDEKTPQYEKEAMRTAFRSKFTSLVENEVRFNNWNMGCLDLQFLAPYFRAILYRQGWDHGRSRQIIFDVGANIGDDAELSMQIFHGIAGMCKAYQMPVQVVSVEPSPSVFCQMKKAVGENDMLLTLNVALSNATGYLKFSDPGDEGGRLVGSDFQELGLMTDDDMKRLSQCQLSGDFAVLDKSRESVVPTYTMDLLWKSLVDRRKVQASDKILALKIDTEGHDKNVVFGSVELLKEKRITFIIFETMRNAFVKEIAQFVDPHGYICFLITPKVLVPIDVHTWWYTHMDTFTDHWWGNGVCGIRDSESMKQLWRMYHSDDLELMIAYDKLFL